MGICKVYIGKEGYMYSDILHFLGLYIGLKKLNVHCIVMVQRLAVQLNSTGLHTLLDAPKVLGIGLYVIQKSLIWLLIGILTEFTAVYP